jgi:hypothetical protein
MRREVLWEDAARRALHEWGEVPDAVMAVVERLTEDPDDPRLGTKWFQSSTLTGIRATPVGSGRVHVFWRLEDDGSVVVQDVQPLAV